MNLRKWRLWKDIKQHKVAEDLRKITGCKITQSHISHWESGKTIPRKKLQEAIAIISENRVTWKMPSRKANIAVATNSEQNKEGNTL